MKSSIIPLILLLAAPRAMALGCLVQNVGVSTKNVSGNSAAGGDTDVQFNNSNSLAGSANLTWDGSTLKVTGSENISGTMTITGNAFGVGVATLSVRGGYVGVGLAAPAHLFQVLTSTFTVDSTGKVSIGTMTMGPINPPNSQALCLIGGALGYCTSVVGAVGGCTCASP